MSNHNSAEVHFHQQEQLSVYLQSSVSADKERTGEIGSLAFYALRMLSNLGANETSDQLASFLLGGQEAVPLLASGQATGGFELIQYPGHAGRHSFLTVLTWGGPAPRFDFKTKGFGFFAKGMGYYGPVSVMGLLRQLAAQRADDPAFHDGLGQAAMLFGQLHMNRQIGMTNQNEYGIMAMALGAEAMTQYGE